MRFRKRFALPVLLVAALFVAGGVFANPGSFAWWPFTHVPVTNPRVAGIAAPNILPPELYESPVAQGSTPVENPVDPDASDTRGIGFYGYNTNGPHIPAFGTNVEATKSEPDKNTYLVVRNQHGADPLYDYGTHFLYQGHENGRGHITRVNLDADGDHKVTVLAYKDSDNNNLPTFDGSTWYPFSKRLLFTWEGNGSSGGGVWQAPLDYPSTVDNLQGIMGRGGYEGIQADAWGSIILVEDIGGSTVGGARVANSFVYKFVPKNKFDLKQGGKLQVLQVMSKAHAGPIVFDGTNALTQDQKDLHTYGNWFSIKWVTIHNTDVDGTAPFNANALAKTMQGTPFKRPENGQFRPGSNFGEFIFDETGDTSATTTAGDYGGFGGLMRLRFWDPNSGSLQLLFKGDLEHTGLDNCTFWSSDWLLCGEDRGDGLHEQGNAFDSMWLFDVNADYSKSSNQPQRLLALGRDASATIDAQLSGTAGFQNDGDNETTGIHISDGDPGVGGLLGAKNPKIFQDGWRFFYTQQHGDNVTYEVFRKENDKDDDGHHGYKGNDYDHDGRKSKYNWFFQPRWWR